VVVVVVVVDEVVVAFVVVELVVVAVVVVALVVVAVVVVACCVSNTASTRVADPAAKTQVGLVEQTPRQRTNVDPESASDFSVTRSW
jgi:hypothetical protein